jgi:chemotaxis-related protein WspB
MLCLLFHIGNDRYALDTSEIAVVLAPAVCKQIPEAPPWVHGIFSYRGCHVPVLDISMLAQGQHAAARLSTRLVLVRYVPPGAQEQTPQLLGLLVEKATETLKCVSSDFHASGVSNVGARYLGPLMQHQGKLIQWVQIADLLDEATQALLFPQASPA